MTEESKFANLFAGEDPSRRYSVCWIDLPSRLIEPLPVAEPISNALEFVRRLENANGGGAATFERISSKSK